MNLQERIKARKENSERFSREINEISSQIQVLAQKRNPLLKDPNVIEFVKLTKLINELNQTQQAKLEEALENNGALAELQELAIEEGKEDVPERTG